MNSIILMNHGEMAKETLNSAKMILGDQINYPVVSMEPNDGIEGTMSKLEAILETIPQQHHIVILADLLGGTPANVAMMKASVDSRIEVLTGMNLGTVLESFFNLEKVDLGEHLLEIGRQGIQQPKLEISDDEE